MVVGKLTSIINKVKKIKTNFEKNKSRLYTAKHILVKTNEFHDLKKKFKEVYKQLVDSGTVNGDILDKKRTEFQTIAFALDNILTEKTLTLTHPGDESKSEIELLELDSEDTLEEFSEEEFEEDTQESSSNNIAAEVNTMSIDKFKALKHIPQLAQDGTNLKSFITITKEFEVLGGSAEEKSEFLNFILETRINDTILTKLSIYPSPATTDELNNQLLKIFKPTKTSLQLQGELSNEKQGNKKVDDFAKKIETLTSELNKIRLNGVNSEEVKTFVRREIDETGLNAFCIGLNEPYKTVVLASKPTDLTSAIQTAKSYESSTPRTNQNVYNYNTNRNNNSYRRNNQNSNNRYHGNNNSRRNFNQNSNGNRPNNSRQFHNSDRRNQNNQNNNFYNNNRNNNNNQNRSYNNRNRNNNNNNFNQNGNRNNFGNYRPQNGRNSRVNQVIDNNSPGNAQAPEVQALGDQNRGYQHWVQAPHNQ